MEDKAKILLVDDDTEYVNNFGAFLERKGYIVLKSGTGRFGIEVAEKEKPNIILCDLLMRDITGEMVFNEVKEKRPDTIFIVVSAYVDEQTKERLKKLGAHSFIEKIVLFKPTEAYIRQLLEEKNIIHKGT
jgi:DNA-binding NtrC family response regulator